jgi:hypothetical protein
MAPLLRLTQIQRLLEVELRPPTVEVGWSSWRPVRKGRAAHRRSGVAAELARRSWRGPREERRERGGGGGRWFAATPKDPRNARRVRPDCILQIAMQQLLEAEQ